MNEKFVLLILISALWGTALLHGGDDAATNHSFPKWDAKLLISEKMCAICHKKEEIGNQFAVWEAGVHANAYEVLSSEKAKEVAAKMGVENSQNDGKCLQCHSTAYGFSQALVTTKVKVEEGVACQTCHGPGDKYKTKDKHAENTQQAIEKFGLIRPDEANTCSRCHNEDNPTYNPERYTTKDGRKVDFDFEQALQKIRHPLKK